MKIRKATEEDLETLNKILTSAKAHWDYDPEFVKKFVDFAKLTPKYISENETFIVSIEEQDIGFYSFIMDKQNQLELDKLFLHPDFIGKGIGKKIWGICVEAAKKYGVSSFILWSEPYAEGFYEKMGCKKIGVRKSPLMPDRYPPVYRYELTVESK